ncbi:MAG: hypothetical protein ACYC0B_07690 [Gemmatimonadaceae bacterium]
MPFARILLRRLALGLCLCLPSVLRAQAESPRLRVFLDCPSGGCDRNFFVAEIPFALWTQDRLDSDVHVLVTGIGTGAGGTEYTMAFIGRREFVARADTLRAFIAPNSTDDMRRRELARVLQIGLVPFAVRMGDAARFSVRYDAPPEVPGNGATVKVSDPWDFWVYRARLNGSGSAESRSSNHQLSGSINASRVTERWKVSFNAYDEYRSSSFTLSDSTETTFILRSLDASSRVVRSVSDHWSVGTRLAAGMSEFRNQDAWASLDLSAEYNLFPWRDATSRQLIALVAVGARHYDYDEITIYERASETRPVARAIVAGESRLEWGSLDGALRYTRFLHDSRTYNLSVNGRALIRISRGLSLEIRGDAAKVHDQLYLARGDASDDEVLTRQRSLATAFRYGGAVGLSFTFGSIYNTIVNPRLDDLGT